MSYIARPRYMDRIEGFLDKPGVAKVLTGMRRSGKSVLLQMIRDRLVDRGAHPEQILYLNFDVMANMDLRSARVLDDHIRQNVPETGPYYVLFDEIQEVDQWEHVVNSLISQGRADIYLTGSNSRLLSSELATYIAGRYISFEVSTLGFSEYVAFCHETGMGGMDTESQFQSFLMRGGFPGLFAGNYSDEQARQIVTDIYGSTLIRDVLTRRGIRSTETFERIASFALDNVGNPFSARRVSDFLKSERKTISHQTVADYLDAMTEAYLLYRVRRFDLQGKAHLASSEKYYAGDHGLINALLGYSVVRLPGLLENVVQAELRRRGFNVSVGKLGDREVDFIATRRGERIYIQVSASILDPQTREREYAPLLAIMNSFPKYVLSLDSLAAGNVEGVHHRNLRDFLLDDSWG